MAQNSRYVGPIFTVIGTLFAAIGIYFALDAFEFAGQARTTMGEVIHVETRVSRDSDGRRSTTYQPTLRYMAANGQTYEAETHISSSGYDYDIGERMEILYDPADLTEVRINGFFSLYIFPIAFTFGGLLFAAIGIFVWRSKRRGRVLSVGQTIERTVRRG